MVPVSFFWKYVFPALFGLLNYVSIRLVNDVISETQFWKRSWVTNGIEIGMSLVMGFVFDRIVRYFVRRFGRRHSVQLTFGVLLKEFATVYFYCLLTIHLTLIPMAALTDDGLQLYDVVNINLIPILYVLLYYAIARGNTYLRFTYEQQMQLEKVRNDGLQTELKFLKAQYHPHFLFNALNTVYFQMDSDIEGAKKTLEKFSHLLRYQLYDQQTTVPIRQELAYLQNFIDLQRLRSSDKLDLRVDMDPALGAQEIYPLLLLPLIENAFKYVGGAYTLSIGLGLREDWLDVWVENALPESITNLPNRAGLENLKRRLALLYPQAHTLELTRTENHYQAHLTIRITPYAAS